MAQILKFAGGGSTPSSSWGTFTINNVTYKMDDDNIQRLYDHAKTLDPDVAHQFDFIINTLKSGKNLSYSNNKLYGGVDFETSDRQAKKIKEKPARGFGKGRDARLAISSLDNLSLSNPNPETKNIKLNKRFAEYERDNEGNFILSDNNSKKWIKGANNQEILDLLDQIETYSLSPEEFTISGVEGKDAKWLRSFYNSYGKEGWANLKNSISNGTWDQATIEALNDINLFLDRQPTDAELAEKSKREVDEEEARIAREESARYGSSGFNKDQSHLIAYDKTSNSFKIADPNVAQFISSLGNVWLNDEFAQAYPMYAPLLEGHDNGLFVVNGKLYDAEDDALLEIPLVKQWIDENKRKVGGSDLIKWDWKTNPEDNWITDTWNNVPIHNTYGLTNYRDLTGLYDNLGTYNSFPISNIFQVYPDQITPEMYDEFGFFKPEYYNYVAYSNGNVIDDLEPESFNEYLKSLKLSSDSKKNKYYSNMPEYLHEIIVGKNNKKIIKLQNDLYKTEDGNLIKVLNVKGQIKYYVINSNENIDNLTFDSNFIKTHEEVKMSNYFPQTKKRGGKIYKAKYGWVVDLINKSGIPDYLENPKKYTPDATLVSNVYDPNKELMQKAKVNAGYVPPKSYKPEIITTSVTPEQVAAMNKRRGIAQHGATENNLDLNIKGSDLIGIGRFISDIASAHKIYNNNIEAFNDLKKYITPDNVIYKRPIWHFNSGKYQQAKRQLLNTPGIRTSDPTAMHAYDKDRLGKLVDLDLAYNAEMSDSYNKHKNELLAIDNKETQERVARFNEFKSKLAQIRQMELNALNQRDLTIAQNIENKGLELQSKMYQDEQMRNSIANEQLQLGYNQDYLKAVQDKFEQLGGFANFTEEDYKLYGRDILSYMADKYPHEIANIKSNQGLNYKIDAYNNNRMWYSPRMQYAKKGTKLSTFDKLFLSQNKATQRAVENLNKDIVKIFLQMMK